MFFYGKSVLFVGAHPDDIELGAGAVLADMVGKSRIYCVTLSDNRHNPALANLVSEHYASMKLIGLGEEQLEIQQFETRNFTRDRQDILECLYELNRRHQPDLVFTHSPADIHQDHGVTTQETLRAFRGVSVLGFDVLRSSYGFFPSFLVEVSPQAVQKKVNALRAYKTYSDKYYFSEEVVRSTLVRHGALAEKPFAEGFDILRIVGSFMPSSYDPDPSI